MNFKLLIFSLLIFLFLSLPYVVFAETFGAPFQLFDPIFLAGSDLGDLNNNTFMDLFYSGYPTGATGSGVSYLFFNNQNGVLVENTDIELIGAGASTVNFVDVNNDGNLDIFISGQTESNVYQAKLYYGQGDGTFIESEFSLIGVTSATSDWADFNGDGLKDLIICGRARLPEDPTTITNVTLLYKNLGNDEFELVETDLPNVSNGSVAWGDYNNDGHNDVFITGTVSTGVYIAKLFKNLGNETFQEITGNFVGVRYSAIQWGDFDADGDLDILVTGSFSNEIPSVVKIYRNDGNDNFAVVDLPFNGVRQGDVTWADINNNGYLDIVIGGHYTTQLVTGEIYFYNPDNGQYEYEEDTFALKYATFKFGDYNNNSKLDLFITGREFNDNYALIMTNNTENTNNPPQAPSNFNIAVNGNNVYFNWNSAIDDNTPSSGLSYNLKIGTNSQGGDILNPEAHISGQRKVFRLGNMQSKTAYEMILPAGQYYASVQAIDNSFAGSPFSSEIFFTVTDPSEATASPVFNLPSAVYISPIEVQIMCVTENSEIFYTTDGSNPIVGQNPYTEAILITETTVLKALAIAPGFLSSPVVTSIYTFPLMISDLSVLRQQTADNQTIFMLTSEVTVSAQHNYRNQKFIQDASAGIMIDDLNGIIVTETQIGDELSGVVGKLTTFDGMLQLIPVFDIIGIVSSGNIVDPILTTIQEININPNFYESRLIKLINVNFNQAGLFNLNTTYSVFDHTGTGIFKTILNNVNYINTPVPTVPKTVSGIMIKSNNMKGIVARSLEDFLISFPVPQNLSAINQLSHIELSWDLPSDEYDAELTGWNIYRNGVLINSAPLTVDQVTLNDYPDVSGQVYQYSVRALYQNPYGISQNSNTVIVFFGEQFLPPRNLVGNFSNNNLILSWQEPGANEPSWIHWDSGQHHINMGTSDANSNEFMVASRFDTQDLIQYNSMYLSKIRFWPNAPNVTYTLKIWTGGNQNDPGILIYEQVVEAIVPAQWNEVILNEPVYINSNEELWFGYHMNTSAGYPAGADNGPYVNYKGNMMWWNGSWTTLYNLSSSAPYNWNLQGYVSGVSRSNMKSTVTESSRSLTGYYVYKNGNRLNEEVLTVLTYNDNYISEGMHSYYITALYNNTTESIPSNVFVFDNTSVNENTEVSLITGLIGNYPNPFNPETVINFQLEHDMNVRIDIFNIKGQKVTTLLNDFVSKGNHFINWNGKSNNGKSLSSGIYFYRFETNDKIEQRKMLLIK